ncbi:MAG TPA: M1 family aminopeptidase [Terracidiphilus sp.]
MLSPARLSCLLFALVFANFIGISHAQHAANSNAVYQQLRSLTPGSEVITVSNLVLHRDAATFTFSSGSLAFYNEVNGKVTGAVFRGEGHLHITPPSVQERHNLSLAAHAEEFDEDFDQVVLRFTDDTAAELRKGASGKGEPDSDYAKTADEFRSFLRHHSSGNQLSGGNQYYYRKIDGNLDLRLLQDVLSPAPGGFFYAAIRGKKNNHLFFVLDPQGVSGFAPEEVSLENWNGSYETMTYPLAFHRAAEYVNGTASGNEHNAAYRIVSENLDVSIEKNGLLSSLATVELQADQDGVAVVPLDLYPSLRVSKVETDKGEALDYVQEDKSDDPDFGLVLAAPLKKGETATVKITYAGKDVVFNFGQGNYYPTARENWYPNSNQGLGDYATYHMLFHVPKGLQLIATGTKVSEKTDGGITTSEWKTEVPLAVVGFSLGDLINKEGQFSYSQGGGLTVDAYANSLPPDYVQRFSNHGLGTLNTTPMLATELSQGEAAAQVYTNYFGQLPFSHITLTQQSACGYGQSWPMLVYLPICGFFDDTQRHFLLGSDNFDVYWKVVTPHEVAHQWWGQTVGFRSYRDQWMSEGFANTSATIFLQTTGQTADYMEFWKQQHKLLTEKNAFGFRPIDVGPVTMGRRLSSPKSGWSVYQNLVYPKGSYILHMIRMMMWTPQDGDARFRATMHDLLNTYRMQAATTEDFKAVVEKHMSKSMDLDGNQKMDWFFNEYVYGIELPTYHFEGQVTQSGDITSLHVKLTQADVSPAFKMLVPIYLEFTDGKVTRLGTIPITGSSTFERTFPISKLPGTVKKVSINNNYDVLSIGN